MLSLFLSLHIRQPGVHSIHSREFKAIAKSESVVDFWSIEIQSSHSNEGPVRTQPH